MRQSWWFKSISPQSCWFILLTQNKKEGYLGRCAELVSQLTVTQPPMHCRFESYSTHFCNRPIMVLELPAKESVVSSAYRFKSCRLRFCRDATMVLGQTWNLVILNRTEGSNPSRGAFCPASQMAKILPSHGSDMSSILMLDICPGSLVGTRFWPFKSERWVQFPLRMLLKTITHDRLCSCLSFLNKLGLWKSKVFFIWRFSWIVD